MSKFSTKLKSVRITDPVWGLVRVALGLILYVLLGLPVMGQVLIPLGSAWNYAPESSTPLATTNPNWNAPGFAETGWTTNQSAPFGFGSQTYGHPLVKLNNQGKNYPIYYFRKTITIPDAGAVAGLRLLVKYDDAVVVYLNGHEVALKNMVPNPAPGEGAYYGYPAVGSTPDTIDVVLGATDLVNLVNGPNVIAVELHQGGSQSSDAYFDLQLDAISNPPSGNNFIPLGSAWNYAPESSTPLAATNPNWNAPGFAETGWTTNQSAPFGFGSQTYGHPLVKLNNQGKNYPIYYFRKTITIPDAGAVDGLRLLVKYDDAVVVYLNGHEVARKNMFQNPGSGEGDYYGYPAVGSTPDTIDVVLGATDLVNLVNGPNVIAVELHQGGSQSSDAYFDLQLESAGISLTRYPYLQLPGHDQMSVWWYTNLPSSSTVRYSVNSDMSSATDVPVATVDTLHKVTLTGLLPKTKYYYLVGYGTGSGFVPLQNIPTATNFRTQPSPTDTTQTMRFWLLGDSGAGVVANPRPKKVRDAYLYYLNYLGNPPVNAILFLGDNSKKQDFEGLQPALDHTLFKFYNQPNDQQLLSRIPSWTVMGNHDYEPDRTTKDIAGSENADLIRKAYYRQMAASFSSFAFPASGEIGGEPTNNKKGYYSFNQGPIHFVVLNPYLIEKPEIKSDMWADPSDIAGIVDIHGKNSISLDNRFDTPIDSLEQVKWLRKDLENNSQKWTVVTFHQPPFTTMGHFSEGPNAESDLIRVRERLMPILEKPEYHVDALLVSHSHAYLRAGMIRKNGAQPRTTDFTQSGNLKNLGRYGPLSPPYIKTNDETAYSYLVSGSAGRGWYNYTTLESDGGYADSNTRWIQHPSNSTPPLDNLTNDLSTAFYHVTGGSVELVFRENRLDVMFIKESDIAPFYVKADSFTVMKDVNKTTTLPSPSGTTTFNLRASWVGNYQWYASTAPTTLLATTRTLSVTPTVTTTYFAKDGYNQLADTFQINVNQPIQSVQTGSWHDASTWDCACVPTSAHDVQINATHTVTVSTGDALLKALIKNGGILHLMNGRKLCFSCP